jgi:hypothetical protein
VSYPSTDEHRAKTGRGLEVQTDKEKFKIVPCTYAGCDVDLIVNTFYAPAKGKCEMHNGSSRTAVAVSHLTHVNPNVEAKENGALAKLLCPMCEMPLLLQSVAEDGGFMTFRCAEGTATKVKDMATARRCGTSVQVRPNFAAMEMRSIPTKFAELVAEFNLDQKIAYFDKKEARDG